MSDLVAVPATAEAHRLGSRERRPVRQAKLALRNLLFVAQAGLHPLRRYKRRRRHGSVRILIDLLHPLDGQVRGGAELAMAELSDRLSGSGYELRTAPARTRPTALGWPAFRDYLWADLVFTQHAHLPSVRRYAVPSGTPIVFFDHTGETFNRGFTGAEDLIVFDNFWMPDVYAGIADFQVLLPLPGDALDEAPRAEAPEPRVVTLIGLSELKGAQTLYRLAATMPETSFLGVRARWGDEITPPTDLPNLEILPWQDDMAPVYGRSAIVLLPSSRENFSRVCFEAFSWGIPVIAHPSTGAVTTGSTAAIYAHRDDTAAWARTIGELLGDATEYARRRELGRSRARALGASDGFPELEQRLRRLAGRAE